LRLHSFKVSLILILPVVAGVMAVAAEEVEQAEEEAYYRWLKRL